VRTHVRLGAVLAVLVLLAAACGGGGDDDGDDGGQAVSPEEISGTVVLTGWASSPTETLLLNQVVAAFEQKYPNINVAYSPISGDYPAAMLAKFSARTPPDVFYVDSNVVPDWIDQQVLQPLDGYIESNDFDTGPFFDPLLEAFTGPDGSIYGLPKDWSPLGMFTNDALLAEAGVQPPTNWEELRAAAEAIEVPGGRPICLSPSWDRMLAFVYQNGGSFLNADGTASAINSPEAKEAAEFYVGLINDGLADIPANLGSGWCGEAMGKQTAAIAFEGNWLVPFMEGTFGDVDYTISPMISNTQEGNLAFTVSYSMAADSKNKDAAWVLLSYLTGPEGMGTWTSKGLALPSREDVPPVEGRDPFIQSADASRAWQFAPQFTTVIDTANNELTAVIEGSQTVDGMLQKVDQAANEALQD
jgi:multiple sugar transport system substrate-binding protein